MESDKENDPNVGNTNSQDLFGEDTEFIPVKKAKHEQVDYEDDVTTCSSRSSYKSDREFTQYAQRWSEDDHEQGQTANLIPTAYQNNKRDAAVMTTFPYLPEIDENTRLNNLMFCKFISHELEKFEGDERYNVMQKIIEVFMHRK